MQHIFAPVDIAMHKIEKISKKAVGVKPAGSGQIYHDGG
jgi:hypothetical protein